MGLLYPYHQFFFALFSLRRSVSILRCIQILSLLRLKFPGAVASLMPYHIGMPFRLVPCQCITGNCSAWGSMPVKARRTDHVELRGAVLGVAEQIDIGLGQRSWVPDSTMKQYRQLNVRPHVFLY